MQYNKKDENYVYYLVSKNIKKQRKEKGLTQRQLARVCNYCEGFIMNIESNYHQTFSLGTVWRIAQKLDVDVKVLFNELEDNKTEKDSKEKVEL